MSEATRPPIPFLARLRDINVRRCETCYHPLHAMNVFEWSAAMAGEAGETCNAAKKLHWDQHPERIPTLDRDDISPEDVAREVADTVIYADLLLASLGMSMEDVVRRVFDAKSKKLGFEELL